MTDRIDVQMIRDGCDEPRESGKSDLVERAWNALKEAACVDPDKAHRIVMLDKLTFELAVSNALATVEAERDAWREAANGHRDDAERFNQERLTAETRLSGMVEAMSDAWVALHSLINKYGYEDDQTTPKDWSEWVFAREVRESLAALSVLADIEDTK